MADDKTDASKLIDERIKDLGDWRGKTLGTVRGIIQEADPDIVEEWKWVKATNPGTPVWSHNGGVCTGETYKDVVKPAANSPRAVLEVNGATSETPRVEQFEIKSHASR